MSATEQLAKELYAAVPSTQRGSYYVIEDLWIGLGESEPRSFPAIICYALAEIDDWKDLVCAPVEITATYAKVKNVVTNIALFVDDESKAAEIETDPTAPHAVSSRQAQQEAYESFRADRVTA